MESQARVLRADGDYRWLLIRNVPLRDELGNIVNWYGSAIDIEERHRVEEALRRSEAYLHDAQRLSHTGSWRHDFVSGLVTTSPEALRIWGVNADEDASPFDFFFGRMHGEDRPAVEHEYRAAQIRKADFGADFRIVLPDGTVKNIHAIGHPTLNQSGVLIEFVGTVMDVTERKRAEEALRKAQAELAHVARVTTMGEMAASIAHEIKQPITAAVTDAKTCLRWLGRSEPDVPEASDAVERIIKDVTRAADIISSISELFKKGSSQREWVDVNELIREMIVLLRSEATRYSISIGTELDPDLPRVMADRLQLQQVFMNLMLNGIDAMKHGSHRGELTIRSQADDGSLVISVSDTGPGLPPEQGDQIFRAFFTTKDHGIGMGLPISRSIIESHGGRLWASGNSPQGATFQFSLPATIATHA
jgi:PAS domain S-box-containing protein